MQDYVRVISLKAIVDTTLRRLQNGRCFPNKVRIKPIPVPFLPNLLISLHPLSSLTIMLQNLHEISLMISKNVACKIREHLKYNQFYYITIIFHFIFFHFISRKKISLNWSWKFIYLLKVFKLLVWKTTQYTFQ